MLCTLHSLTVNIVNHANVIETDQTIADAHGSELYVSYQLNENFKVETGYNKLVDEDSDAELKYIPVAVVYNYGAIQLSGTYKFESSEKANGDKAEDAAILQARYYF